MELTEITGSKYTSIYSSSSIDKVTEEIDFIKRESYDNRKKLLCIKIEQLRYDELSSEWVTTYYKPTNKEG
tara:strand:- start:281 stop:493 length:213 start_codon:yes stop_codon:yes gene_type:complete